MVRSASSSPVTLVLVVPEITTRWKVFHGQICNLNDKFMKTHRFPRCHPCHYESPYLYLQCDGNWKLIHKIGKNYNTFSTKIRVISIRLFSCRPPCVKSPRQFVSVLLVFWRDVPLVHLDKHHKMWEFFAKLTAQYFTKLIVSNHCTDF